MPISLRIPESKEHLLKRYAARVGKTKTAVILEAVDEKLGLTVDRKDLIRNLSGWMNERDAEELRLAAREFDIVNDGDWE